MTNSEKAIVKSFLVAGFGMNIVAVVEHLNTIDFDMIVDQCFAECYAAIYCNLLINLLRMANIVDFECSIVEKAIFSGATAMD